MSTSPGQALSAPGTQRGRAKKGEGELPLLPDLLFPPPLQGFEPRDTDIGRKLVVWRALQALTGPRKLLSLSPDLELNR